MACEPLPCGLARLTLWEHLLALDGDAGSFQPKDTFESKSSRRGNRADYQTLKFGLESGPAVDTVRKHPPPHTSGNMDDNNNNNNHNNNK